MRIINFEIKYMKNKKPIYLYFCIGKTYSYLTADVRNYRKDKWIYYCDTLTFCKEYEKFLDDIKEEIEIIKNDCRMLAM